MSDLAVILVLAACGIFGLVNLLSFMRGVTIGREDRHEVRAALVERAQRAGFDKAFDRIYGSTLDSERVPTESDTLEENALDNQ